MEVIAVVIAIKNSNSTPRISQAGQVSRFMFCNYDNQDLWWITLLLN